MTFGGRLWKRQAPTHVVEGATALWDVRYRHLGNTGLVFVGRGDDVALVECDDAEFGCARSRYRHWTDVKTHCGAQTHTEDKHLA